MSLGINSVSNSLSSSTSPQLAESLLNSSDGGEFAEVLKNASAQGVAEKAISESKENASPKIDVEQLINGLSNGDEGRSQEEVEALFSQFVGESFFGQLMKQMRTSVGKSTYFHGGRAEEMFTSQLDQQFTQIMAESYGDDIAEPMMSAFRTPLVG